MLLRNELNSPDDPSGTKYSLTVVLLIHSEPNLVIEYLPEPTFGCTGLSGVGTSLRSVLPLQGQLASDGVIALQIPPTIVPVLVCPHTLASEVHGTGTSTVTVTDCMAEVPPAPVHWNSNVVSEVRWSVKPLPFKLSPVGDVRLDHGPYAVQLVAFVELQVRVERPLYATGLGETVIEAVGTGGGEEVPAMQRTEKPELKL